MGGTARAILVCLIASADLASVSAHEGPHATASARLPVIGPAAGFTLTSHDGMKVSLADFRGKTVVIAFTYTSCTDVCPILISKLLAARADLGPKRGARVVVLCVTVDPEHDTVQVLKDYAQAVSADNPGWHFLTGSRPAIEAAARGYGVVVRKMAGGDVDHTLLTSLVDRNGRLRVQYLGSRFAVEEFVADLIKLADGP